MSRSTRSGLALREGAGADSARRFPKHVNFALAGLALHYRNCGFQVLDAACDIGVARGLRRMAIAFMIHGPYVEARVGEKSIIEYSLPGTSRS